jgi:hypothetical protein
MPISSALGSSALLPAGLGFRNLLINGDFRINQRGYASASNLASGAYGFDRWKSTFTNTTLTFTSAPQGQIVTINSGGSIEQVIEQQNITAGTFVLSWTGTATGRVYNTGATPPAYAASPIIVTLDGLANVEVEFTASGATKTLWKPQLEQNYQPTPFEQRPIGVELVLCQRYFTRLIDPPGIGTGHPTFTASRCSYSLPVEMRAIPNLTSSGTFNFWNGGFTLTASTISASFRSRTGVEIDWSGSGIFTQGQCIKSYTGNGSNYLDCAAEL